MLFKRKSRLEKICDTAISAITGKKHGVDKKKFAVLAGVALLAIVGARQGLVPIVQKAIAARFGA